MDAVLLVVDGGIDVHWADNYLTDFQLSLAKLNRH